MSDDIETMVAVPKFSKRLSSFYMAVRKSREPGYWDVEKFHLANGKEGSPHEHAEFEWTMDSLNRNVPITRREYFDARQKAIDSLQAEQPKKESLHGPEVSPVPTCYPEDAPPGLWEGISRIFKALFR